MRNTGIATRSWLGIVLLSLGILLFSTDRVDAGFRIIKADFGDDDRPYVNLIVREVRVTPVVAHVGDTIRFEMVLENHGDAVDLTIPIDILANGKEVSGKLFTFGWSNEPGKMYRETFQWNTSGVPPGEYRIRGDAFVWDDDNPFDNFLDVKEPLVLLPVGASLPAGKENGRTAIEVN